MPGRLRQALAAARPPADVKAAVGPGEHLLSWGRDDTGAALVATDRGLWGYGERLAWEEIDNVRWADGVMTILAVDGETRAVPLPDSRDLPAVVRAQVDTSVLHVRPVPLLPDGRGVTVVARRLPGGEVSWQLRFDAGVNAEDPALRQQGEEALARVRGELGI